MKFWFIFHQTFLHLAIEVSSAEIVKLLLAKKNIDVNCPYVFIKKNIFKISK